MDLQRINPAPALRGWVNNTFPIQFGSQAVQNFIAAANDRKVEKTDETVLYKIVAIDSGDPDEIERLILANSPDSKQKLEWLRENLRGSYRHFLVSFAKSTVKLKYVKFVKRAEFKDRNDLDWTLNTLGDKYYLTLKSCEKMNIGMEKSQNIIQLLLEAGINFTKEKHGKARESDKNPKPDFFSVTDIFDECRELSIMRYPNTLFAAAYKYVTAYKQTGIEMSGFFKTINTFILPIIEQEKYGWPVEKEKDKLISQITDKLLDFGTAIGSLENNPSSEAFWGLRIAGRDINSGNSFGSINKIIDDYIALGERLYKSGEKDMLKLYCDFQWSGPPKADIDKLAKIHDYFGILRFSKVMENEEDASIMDELIKNWEDKSYNANKEIAVITLPREGGSGLGSILGADTFSYVRISEIIRELSKNYKVFVFDIAADINIEDVLRRVEEREGRKTSIFIHGAHSSQTGSNYAQSVWGNEPKRENPFQLLKDEVERKNRTLTADYKDTANYFHSGKFYPKNEEEMKLDINSQKDLGIMKRAAARIKEGGAIIVVGCEAGKGEDSEKNIINAWATEAPGRYVVGATQIINGIKFHYNSEGKIDASSSDALKKSIEFLPSEGIKEVRTYVKFFPGANK